MARENWYCHLHSFESAVLTWTNQACSQKMTCKLELLLYAPGNAVSFVLLSNRLSQQWDCSWILMETRLMQSGCLCACLPAPASLITSQLSTWQQISIRPDRGGNSQKRHLLTYLMKISEQAGERNCVPQKRHSTLHSSHYTRNVQEINLLNANTEENAWD